MRLTDCVAAIESVANPAYQASWDKSGLQVASTRKEVTRIAVCLDPMPATIGDALEHGADFILSHHPLSLKPALPNEMDNWREALQLLLCADVPLYAAHTSLDVNMAGPAGWLARELRLTATAVLEPCGYLPKSDLSAPSPNGCAKDRSPKKMARCVPDGPAGGCRPRGRSAGLKARLKKPASQCRNACENSLTYGFGQLGTLPAAIPADEFLQDILRLLKLPWAQLCGAPPPEQISRVAICGGSGGSLLKAAAGADIFITGDIKHHTALDAQGLNVAVLDVGHHALEEEMMRRFASCLRERLVSVDFLPAPSPFHLVRQR